MSRTLFKFCLPFDEATPAIHFWKAIKRSRNTVGLACVNRCEKVWTGFKKSEQVWSTVFPRLRVASSPNFEFRHSNIFPSTIFKQGLLEGSTFLFQYSYTSRTPLGSSWLGELKYAISARWHVRSKNNRFRNGKIQRETATGRRA